ncbi:hypothetical protein cypCar_00021672 [Cyprinus carpio]|nr:hypothetical protein cypCar_00021672 [Cyprinus carpio]
MASPETEQPAWLFHSHTPLHGHHDLPNACRDDASDASLCALVDRAGTAYEAQRRRELVLITGSGGALGRLFALELSKHGAELVLWDINGETNERRQQGGQAHAYTVDVTNREQVYRTANQVRKEVGRCDLLGEQRRGAGRRETPGLY